MACFYLFEDIIVRYATEDEKNTLYNAIGKHFTEEYDKDWYKYFTDSSYFDIQDYLLNVFRIKVREYDDDLIYPDFINDIHNYIWDKLCEAMGVPNTVEDNPEMVNKQKFIEKACEIYRKHLIKFNPTLKEFPTALEDAVNVFRTQMEE